MFDHLKVVRRKAQGCSQFPNFEMPKHRLFKKSQNLPVLMDNFVIIQILRILLFP